MNENNSPNQANPNSTDPFGQQSVNPPVPTPPPVPPDMSSAPPPPPPPVEPPKNNYGLPSTDYGQNPQPSEPATPPPPPPPVPPAAPEMPDIPTPLPPSLDSSSDASLPPVMSPPQQKKTGKIVGALAAILLLVVSVPLGIFLLNQNQEVREKADERGQAGRSGLNGACTTTDDCQFDLTCKSGKCKWNSGIGVCCGIDSQCTSGQTCSGTDANCESEKSCSGSIQDPGQSGRSGLGGYCTTTNDCQFDLTCKNSQCKWNSGTAGCCGLDSQCGTGGKCDVASDICESGLACRPAGVVSPTNPPQPTGGGGGQGPTPSVGPITPPSLEVYKYQSGTFELVQRSKWSDEIAAGDTVKFCANTVSGTDRFRVKIDGASFWQSPTDVKETLGGAQKFCARYEIPAGKTSIRVNAQLHKSGSAAWTD